jgi:hypothetical protein
MFIIIAATWIIYNSLIILSLSCQFHGFKIFMDAEFTVPCSRRRFHTRAWPFTLITTDSVRFRYQMHFTILSAIFSATLIVVLNHHLLYELWYPTWCISHILCRFEKYIILIRMLFVYDSCFHIKFMHVLLVLGIHVSSFRYNIQNVFMLCDKLYLHILCSPYFPDAKDMFFASGTGTESMILGDVGWGRVWKIWRNQLACDRCQVRRKEQRMTNGQFHQMS